jgi:hypothetical protein
VNKPSERQEEKCDANPPYPTHQLSVFSAPANYGVVKIVCSSSEVVLQTMKHTMIYPSSSPSSEVIALCPVV